MAEEQKKYVVYGMRAKCSEGSMENYISTDTGHGVVYQGNPLLNANDHTPQVNLTHFGDCHSKLIYEEAKKQADEKYKADADDGFFSKAGKFIARNVTKAALTAKEYLGANKCELDTPLPWMFANEEHMIDGAPALTVESQCACRFGGVISIVPMEEEAAAEEEAAEAEAEEPAKAVEGTAGLKMMPAVAARGFVPGKAAEGETEEGLEKLASAAQTAAKVLKEGREIVEGRTKGGTPWAGVSEAIGRAMNAGTPYAGVSEVIGKALRDGKKAAEEAEMVENTKVEVYAAPLGYPDTLPEEQQDANAEYIYNYLTEKGWTCNAICGLLGNIEVEGIFNPGEWQSWHDGSSGYGLVQWDDALDFLEYMDGNEKDADKLYEKVDEMAECSPKELMDLELEFLLESCSPSENNVSCRWIETSKYGSPYEMSYDEYIKSEESAYDLALVFHASYERSGDDEKKRKLRAEAADRWYDHFCQE